MTILSGMAVRFYQKDLLNGKLLLFCGRKVFRIILELHMLGLLKRARYENIELKKPTLPVLILIAVLVIGTLGYNIIWSNTESSLIDDFYMTVITITTIGYQELYPLDTAGRIFTIFVGVTGIGSLFYVLSVVMENLFILQIHNIRGLYKMEKKIEKLEGHIVLAGMGRVGRLAAMELYNRKVDFVVIDENFEDAELIEKLGILRVKGDATEDATLMKAGIERAKGMIVATANSATTVFVVLSAKVLNPKLFIVARADEENNIEKLKKAGANKIVNPYAIGGVRLAHQMINPQVVKFMESGFLGGESDLTIENINISENSACTGKTLIQLDIRKLSGATIVAVLRNKKLISNPAGDFLVQSGDRLVAMGTPKQLKKLEELVLNS